MATFEAAGCFHLFLVLEDKSITLFLVGTIISKSSAMNTRVFDANFEGNRVCMPIS